MTRQEISKKILALLDCDGDTIINAIFALAYEVCKDKELDAMLCNNCRRMNEHVTDTITLYSCSLTGLGTHPTEPCHCFKEKM